MLAFPEELAVGQMYRSGTGDLYTITSHSYGRYTVEAKRSRNRSIVKIYWYTMDFVRDIGLEFLGGSVKNRAYIVARLDD